MRVKGLQVGRIAPLVTALLAAALAYFSPVTATNSDPQFGLLVSQTMLRHRTVQMDAYRETLGPVLERAFVVLDGHVYYYFPLGTPIFSMPVVGAANLLGWDMADAVQEAALQNLLSAVLVGLSFLVIYRICRCFLPTGAALVITATAFLGSALISTMSTALWSIDFAVLFVALSLLVLSKQATDGAGRSYRERRFYPYLLGFFLFGAYLCRPSTFLFVALVLGYLLLVDRRTFWRTAVCAFVLLAGFLLFIRLGYGSWLPPYYNDFGRLAVERRPLYEAYFGNLVSPSRGLLVYSPFFLLTLVGAAFYFHRLKRKPLFWLMLSWFLLHLLLVARTTIWWGGSSFGPRILAELLPGLILLTAMVGQVFLAQNGRWRLRFAVTMFYGVLAFWAVFLNSYQGLFNHYTTWWHGALTPIIDYEPEYLWSWKYPQFLAGNESLCLRDREYIEMALKQPQVVRSLSPYEPGRPIAITADIPAALYELMAWEGETAVEQGSRSAPISDGTSAYFPLILWDERQLEALISGWSVPQMGYRWSMCEMATIAFKLDDEVETGQPYELLFNSGSFGEQRVRVSLNGVDLGQVVFNGTAAPAATQTIMIPVGVLKPGLVNQIVLDLPDSIVPDVPGEQRRVGLSLVSFAIQPAD